ncbi:MAG TPA: hypothetical protein VGK33_02180, partial [Chloroflexota bacterium]
MAAPAFAAGSSGGNSDDSATITQTGENLGTANQHQPGDGDGNVATITQAGGTQDVATQQQWRANNGVDFAITSHETITQSNNFHATASQEDNGDGGDVQQSTQKTNANVTSTQTINEPFGTLNSQTSTQGDGTAGNANVSSSVTQTIGTNPSSTTQADNHNTQTATQLGQVGSSISQLINGGSNDTQNALEDPGANNHITQTSFGSNEQETATITNGSNNN